MSSPSELPDNPPVASSPVPPRLGSLRRMLLASHLALATLVIVGFGGAALGIAWQSVLRQSESDLLAVAQLMVQDLERSPDAGLLEVSDVYFHRMGPAPRDRAYFAVWDETGRLLNSTRSLPFHAEPAESMPPREGPRPYHVRRQGRHLQLIVATPRQGQLLVGRPLSKEMDGLWRIGRQLLYAFLGCLAIGGFVALWLARRIAKPFEEMTAVAESIHVRDLTRRMRTGQGSRESDRLAASFNRMLASLELAFQKQIRFTADASHELRTPVAVVLSQTDLTLSRERSVEQYKASLETVRQAAARMKRLIDDLLFLARADAGQLTFRRSPIDLHAVAVAACELLLPLAETHQVTIEALGSPAEMEGDPGRLEQMLSNLIVNAILYNRPNGTVRVTVEKTADAVLLKVSDTGVGIPLEEQPKLFDRFYRADAARTGDEETGTGLGLSLVQEIVAAHDGTIELQSELGVGTTVTMKFPARPQELPPTTRSLV